MFHCTLKGYILKDGSDTCKTVCEVYGQCKTCAQYQTGRWMGPNYPVPAIKLEVEINDYQVEIFALVKDPEDTDDDFIIWWETVSLY